MGTHRAENPSFDPGEIKAMWRSYVCVREDHGFNMQASGSQKVVLSRGHLNQN